MLLDSASRAYGEEPSAYVPSSGRTWVIRPEPEFPSCKNVFIADTKAKVRQAVQLARTWKIAGVDTETYDCDMRKFHPFGRTKIISVQIAGAKGQMVFIPMWKGDDPQGRIELLFELAEWLEEDTRTKVFHNAKFDMHAFANYGITLNGLLGDTQIMDFLAYNGAQKHGLKEVIRRIAGKEGVNLGQFEAEDSVDYKEVFKEPKPLKRKGKNGETLYGKQTWVVPLTEVIKTQKGIRKLIVYATKDPRFTVIAYKHLREQLKKIPWAPKKGLNYFDYYEQFEVDYTKALFEMECEGAPVDVAHLERVRDDIEVKLVENRKTFLKEAARRQIGSVEYLEKFNMGSGPQVADLFYERLNAPITDLTKGGKTGPKASTSTATLEKLAFRKKKFKPLVDCILRHRRLTKFRKTYAIPIIESAKIDGRIRTNYKQAAVATMRLSSSTPNLQNIPANKKDEEFKLRKAFSVLGLPEWLRDDYVYADIDLSQIELRITAHVTRDPKLLDILNKGLDQHLMAMCLMFPEVEKFVAGRLCTKALCEEVEKHFGKAAYEEMRRRGKVLNFGIIYGMGPQGYARQIGGTVDEGRAAIEAYFSSKGFIHLKRGIKKVQRKCYQKGYVRTLLGRYCVIPGIRSSDNGIRASAERKAFNYVVQGSAADLLKMAMVLIFRCEQLRKWGVKMLLQIHDELVFLIPKRYLEKAKKLIEAYVSKPYEFFGFSGLVVPTPADLGHGANWLEAK